MRRRRDLMSLAKVKYLPPKSLKTNQSSIDVNAGAKNLYGVTPKIRFW